MLELRAQHAAAAAALASYYLNPYSSAGSARREVLELRAQRAAAATALASVDGRLAGLVAELGALGGRVAALEAGDGAGAQVPPCPCLCAACQLVLPGNRVLQVFQACHCDARIPLDGVVVACV